MSHHRPIATGDIPQPLPRSRTSFYRLLGYQVQVALAKETHALIGKANTLADEGKHTLINLLENCLGEGDK